MILRLSGKIAKKIHVKPAAVLPADSNPYADWSTHVFLAARTQYILVTNTASLYSLCTSSPFDISIQSFAGFG
jgi:hypothetical protein